MAGPLPGEQGRDRCTGGFGGNSAGSGPGLSGCSALPGQGLLPMGGGFAAPSPHKWVDLPFHGCCAPTLGQPGSSGMMLLLPELSGCAGSSCGAFQTPPVSLAPRNSGSEQSRLQTAGRDSPGVTSACRESSAVIPSTWGWGDSWSPEQTGGSGRREMKSRAWRT